VVGRLSRTLNRKSKKGTKEKKNCYCNGK